MRIFLRDIFRVLACLRKVYIKVAVLLCSNNLTWLSTRENLCFSVKSSPFCLLYMSLILRIVRGWRGSVAGALLFLFFDDSSVDGTGFGGSYSARFCFFRDELPSYFAASTLSNVFCFDFMFVINYDFALDVFDSA